MSGMQSEIAVRVEAAAKAGETSLFITPDEMSRLVDEMGLEEKPEIIRFAAVGQVVELGRGGMLILERAE